VNDGETVPSLEERDVDADPIRQFELWFRQARVAHPLEPEAMTLATATAEGRPSARMVLLKSYDRRGFTFFTNYESRKGTELAANPWAALVFFWGELHRQVRVEGPVERVESEESDSYFTTRTPGSRLGAVASSQSRIIPDRDFLDRRVQELARQYSHTNIPRPDYWGGFRVVPAAVEFWQGQPNRLHDRLRYDRGGDGRWTIVRLSP
jgi:pyridoxamine 5'-phosphate oxidase